MSKIKQGTKRFFSEKRAAARAENKNEEQAEGSKRRKVGNVGVPEDCSLAGVAEEGSFVGVAVEQCSEIPKSICIDGIELPDKNWKLLTWNLSDEGYLCFEQFTSAEGWPVIRKAVKVDCKNGQASFKVFGNVCDEFFKTCNSFTTKEELESILLRFHNTNLCLGIDDEKYHVLRLMPQHDHQGIFQNNIWRSVK